MLAGAKLVTTMNHHHKTVTSITLSRDGKFLISGSLDRQIVWTDLSLFRQVYSKHCSSSVMSVAVGGQDDYLGIGMLDGLIQIHKRKEERMEDGIIFNSRRPRIINISNTRSTHHPLVIKLSKIMESRMMLS